MRKILMIAVAAGAMQLMSQSAAAQVFGLSGNLTGLPYNYFQSQQELPFYAKFPPVYYSYPVARTYGYSPFAYPPGFVTPELHAAAPPVEIVNPYVPAAPEKAPAELPAPSADAWGRTRGELAAAIPPPKVIVNPYVQVSDAPAPLNDARGQLTITP